MDEYKADDHCWLNMKTDTIWAFVGPVLFVLMVCYSTYSTSSQSHSLSFPVAIKAVRFSNHLKSVFPNLFAHMDNLQYCKEPYMNVQPLFMTPKSIVQNQVQFTLPQFLTAPQHHSATLQCPGGRSQSARMGLWWQREADNER